MLWSQLTDFIRNHRDTQTSAVPKAGSHNSVAGNKASAQDWQVDELETLIVTKYPDAQLPQIAAEKFVDQVMVKVFADGEHDPGAAIDYLSDDRHNSEAAQVLLAYVR